MLDWDNYTRVADRFQHKARFQDRGDLKHNIIVRLAEVAQRNGHKPFTEGAMVRVASFVVLEYWHGEKRNGKVISLNTDIDDGEGNTVELIDTIADDNAIDLEAWVDARIWLLGCPKRLITIAHKRVRGIPLTKYEQLYLCRFWKRQQLMIAF
ncbi:hypothetical protein ES707_07258 [subsurface metagenome]